MTMRAPFNPQRGANQSATTSTTSASIAINATSKSVRIVNTSATVYVFVRVGTGAQTATAADTPIAPGTALVISKADGENTLAYLAASGTPLIYVQTGEGGI